MNAWILTCLLSATSTLSVWLRAPGDYAAAPPAPMSERRVALEPVQRKRSHDIQYDTDAIYEGVPLGQAIERFGIAPKYVDTALLHFANEMIVPVRLDELGKLDAFIAVAQCKQEVCTNDFPPVEKGDEVYIDRRPIRFVSNKVVVASAKGFSPFRHTNSLIGIELVNGRAYERQFEVIDTPGVRRGVAAFRQRCQFCHGVRGVGASFGWDYVKPVALYTYRSPRSLAMHVRHRETDAPQKGVMMPALPDVDDAMAQALWELLEAFGKYPLLPYVPATGG
jgi:hypothetical protein